MNVNRMVLTFAGILILGSLVLPKASSPCGFLFTVFVGAHLFPASFTGFSPLAKILKARGVKSGYVLRV